MRSKHLIRKAVLNRLKSQKKEDRNSKSLAIKERLFRSREFNEADKILLFFSTDYEVDTVVIIKEALKKGKKVFLPVTDVKGRKLKISEITDIEKDTEAGPLGIYQPKAGCKGLDDPGQLDLIVMPGVAFDRSKNRIGHGAGYYDKFLENIPQDIPRIALAFDFQVLDEDIPTLAYDIPVTRVITNTDEHR